VERPDAAARRDDQSGVAELRQVMADGRLAQVEGRREIADADRLGGLGQDVNHLHTGGLPEGGEHAGELGGAGIGEEVGDRLAAPLGPQGEIEEGTGHGAHGAHSTD
jgi:hypothetical protein